MILRFGSAASSSRARSHRTRWDLPVPAAPKIGTMSDSLDELATVSEFLLRGDIFRAIAAWPSDLHPTD